VKDPLRTIIRSARSAPRAGEIVAVLARYGFDEFLRAVGLGRLTFRSPRADEKLKADELRKLSQAARVRRVLEELGTTYIKLGQVLSTRPDLIPADWAKEFEKLQDDAPAVEFESIERVLSDSFGGTYERIIADVDPTPLAAGSIAQVHRATLASGERVVLKIIKPGVIGKVRADIEVLSLLASAVEEYFRDLGYSPTAVVNEFAAALVKELDFRCEGRSTDRLRSSFEDNEHVSFPKVYWEATTQRVLALEEVIGAPLSRLERDAHSSEVWGTLVGHGVDAVFKQCLELGVFHADPHAGNIFVVDEGRICFVDCGMVGHIDPRTRQQLADLVLGVTTGEPQRVLEAVVALADADPLLVQDRAFRADVWEIISRFVDATFEHLNVAELLQDFFSTLKKHQVRCPADIVLLIKAIGTIEGVAERFAPEFELTSRVRGHVERLVRRQYGARAIRRRFRDNVLAYERLFTDLPQHVRLLTRSLERGALTFRIQHEGIEELQQRVETSGLAVARGVMVAAIVLASTSLLVAQAALPTSTVLGLPYLLTIAILGYLLATFLSLSPIILRFLSRLR
jgi:ubiquinone biosynthesis protein